MSTFKLDCVPLFRTRLDSLTELGKLYIEANICHHQILSRDSVTVSVDAVVYFNVIDAEQALCSVDDFRLDRRTDGTVGPSVRRKSATSVCTLVPWDRLRRRQSAWGGSHYLTALPLSFHYA